MTKFSRYSNALGLRRIGLLALVFSLLALVNLPATASGQSGTISAKSLVGAWKGYGVKGGDKGEDCDIRLDEKTGELKLTSSGGIATADYYGNIITVKSGWPDDGITGTVSYSADDGVNKIVWSTRKTANNKPGGHWLQVEK